MEKIKEITAEVVKYDDLTTVKATVKTEHGFEGVAELPSGISVGANEAKLVEPNQAIQNITNIITPALLESDALEQRELDEKLMELDGSPDRSHLGANSLLPVSLAICRAGAAALNRPLYEHISELNHTSSRLPELIQVMIEGGKHSNTPGLTMQEFSVITPVETADKILTVLAGLIASRGGQSQLGGEGGLIAPIQSNHDALTYLSAAINQIGAPVKLAIDAAASHAEISLEEIEKLIQDFELAIIEDPIPEDDITDWNDFTHRYGEQLLVAADDLTVGNPVLIKDAVRQATANAIVLKLNQTATLSEIFDIISLVKVGGWTHIISHRGHETPDTFIVDLAVGTAAQFLKMGTPRSAIRKPKFERYYNEIALQLTKL